MHGYGANSADLFPIGKEWIDHGLEKTCVICPNAPFPIETGDTEGRQWFSLLSFESTYIFQGIKQVTPILEKFIEQQLKRFNLTHDKLVLAGFSQGAMLSLNYGLYNNQSKTIAGIISYSGALILPEDKSISIKHKPPVLLLHGEQDDLIPITSCHSAKRYLEAKTIPITCEVEKNLGHSISNRGIEIAAKFLNTISDHIYNIETK